MTQRSTKAAACEGPDVWRLVIPDYFPPTLNDVAMAHWSKVRKHKAKALHLVTVYALATGGIPRFEGPVSLTITRLWGKRQRAMDIDNLYGSVKPLVDALRAQKKAGGRRDRGVGRQGGLGVIPDDAGSLTLTVHQRKNDGKWGVPADDLATLITIEGRRVK